MLFYWKLLAVCIPVRYCGGSSLFGVGVTEAISRLAVLVVHLTLAIRASSLPQMHWNLFETKMTDTFHAVECRD
jgi:hypothetical protein